MTNLEKVRQMSAQELSKFLFMFEDNSCRFCAELNCSHTDGKACSRGYENWLKQRNKEGMNPPEIIDVLARLSNTADISCAVASNGELFVYTTAEVNSDEVLNLVKALKRRATIHITG